MKKYNGAISLFMVIILLSSFIFGGVFIDASRVIVAKNKVKTSMNSALRSSISYYDTKLVGDYGLYAFDGETAKTNFDKYFKANMRIKDSGINMFKYTINDSKITCSTPIFDSAPTDDTELRRQIAEYSKYRAPVTTTMLLIDKVASVFTNLKNSADKIDDSADALEKFKDQFEKDKNQIKTGLKSAKDNASSQIQKAVNDHIDGLKDSTDGIGSIRDSIEEAIGSAEEGGILGECELSKNKLNEMEKYTDEYIEEAKNVSGIGSEFPDAEPDPEIGDDYPKGTNDDPATQAKEKVQGDGSFRSSVNGFESSVANIKGELNYLVDQLEGKSIDIVREKGVLTTREGEYKSAQKNLELKESALSNALIKRSEYKKARTNLNILINNRTSLLDTMNAEVDKYNSDTQAAAIIKIYRDPTLSPEYDTSKTQEDAKNEVRSNLKSANPELSTAFKAIDDYNNNEKAITAANEAVNNSSSFEAAYKTADQEKKDAQKVRDDAKSALETQQGIVNGLSSDIDNLKNNIDSKIKDLTTLASPSTSDLKTGDVEKKSLLDAIGETDIAKSLKEISDEMNKKMTPYNAGSEDKAESKLGGGILKKIKNICKYASDMFSTFTNPIKLRDNAYMVDYIMDKSTFLTSKTVRDHHFKLGEVEYIIFGKDTQLGNILASVGSITMMRFAINFINYFIKGAGGLIAKAVYGLGMGAAQTALDMRDLLFGDGCGLCPSFKQLKLSYSDHLRLMLFFKFSNQQEGLKTVINTNMKQTLGGGDINNLYTRMTAEVDVEVNLLILPIFFGNFTGANFRNGKYVIKDSATLGY